MSNINSLPFDPHNPDLAHARAAIGRDLGMQHGGTPPNHLFNGLDEVIEYIRFLERRIAELEKGAAAAQPPAP